MGITNMIKNFFLIIFFLVAATKLTSCKTQQPVASQPVIPAIPQKEIKEPAIEKPAIKSEKVLYRNALSIGLVMPFYFFENFPEGIEFDSTEIDSRSLYALSFYEGALLAADSLKRTGIHVQIRVADNSADTSAHHWMLMNYQWMKQNDLNFLHFANNQCDNIAKSALSYRLPVIISQCSNSSPVLNEYTALMTPSTRTQIREAVKFVTEEFPMYKVGILSRQTGRENELAEIFLENLNDLAPGKAMRILPSDTSSWKKRIAADEKEPVIVIPSSDEYFVTAILNTLDLIGKKITIIGMPTWENFETLRLGGFANLDIICFQATWLELNDEPVKLFRENFIMQYKTDISWPAWQGWNLVLNSLQAAYTEKVKDIFPYLFSPVNSGGFENRSVSFIRYAGYETIRLKQSKP
jgi:hypothetical protein